MIQAKAMNHYTVDQILCGGSTLRMTLTLCPIYGLQKIPAGPPTPLLLQQHPIMPPIQLIQ